MKNSYKYLLLIIAFIISIFALYCQINVFSEHSIELQKKILIKQAQTHYYDQVNTRKWNSQFGGVYVKPINGLKPNSYLKDNTLKVDENLTLIKINPAWMTRQLSEIADIKDFHFRIASLNPINPNNKADEFEKRAFQYIEKTNEKEYYEINEKNKFNYMGALITTESCLQCHQHQGYVVGEVSGGISISLNSSEYELVASSIEQRAIILKVFALIFLLSIVFLVYKQLKANENLQTKIMKRTKEILSTKQLLQEVLDTDLSFLMVSDGTKIILANKTMLKFFNVDSLDEFIKKHALISNAFEKVDNKNFLTAYIDGEHWINYLQREQKNKELTILIKQNGENRYFKPHSKEIIIDNQELHIIIFDEITNELKNIQLLKEEASRDTLTKLFNRGKFNDVLSKEIILAQTTLTPLSIIFLDIDNFKSINDTYGHDSGDMVLIELSKILTATVRQGDFVARWGGEEFVITLQSTYSMQASLLAEKIRKNVENYNFTSGGRQTVSLGVTQYKEHEEQREFTKRVDEALYAAKVGGRNRVVVL